MPEITIKMMATVSMVTLSKWPIESSYGENPPIAIVENAWQTASNNSMPETQYATVQATVNDR